MERRVCVPNISGAMAAGLLSDRASDGIDGAAPNRIQAARPIKSDIYFAIFSASRLVTSTLIGSSSKEIGSEIEWVKIAAESNRHVLNRKHEFDGLHSTTPRCRVTPEHPARQKHGGVWILCK